MPTNTQINASEIHERALLVSLKLSSWSARKFDAEVTAEVNEQKEAASDASRVNKGLMPQRVKGAKRTEQNSYHQLCSYMTATRNLFYEKTLLWREDGGERLLPFAAATEFRNMMVERKAEIERLTGVFVREYPALKEANKKKLGKMFQESDYPTVADMRSRFSMHIEYNPIPAADLTARNGMLSELARELNQQHEERLQRAVNNAMGQAWDRLYEVVEHMHERLSTPGAIFRDTLVENLREMCNALGPLNATGDPRLEDLRRRAIERLTVHSVDTLRANDIERTRTAEAADALLRQINTARRVITRRVAA